MKVLPGTTGAARPSQVPAYAAENPYAGQGPVLLEIDEDSGALVLSAPEALVGREIEIRPGSAGQGESVGRSHEHGHHHSHAHHPHAAVIPRPLPDGGTQTCVVYPDVEPGRHTLHLLPDGHPVMAVAIRAGEVTFADWEPEPAA